MYGNNYPNDYENKNIIDGTAREVKPESGNFSGQNASGYQDGGRSNTYGENGSTGQNMYGSYQYQNGGSARSAEGDGTGYGYGGNGYGSTGSYNNSYMPERKPPEKEKKRKGSYWKKALAAVSFGLFFGVCAGIGFYAVESATEWGKESSKTEISETEEKPSGNIVQGTEGTADENGLAAGDLKETGEAQGKAIVMDVSDVASEVMPAIVSINNTYTQTMSYFGQTLRSESTAAGSGIIVGKNDEELLIVSNYHVVESADKLVVQFADGAEAEAQMKGSDPDMDLAVIAVSMKDVDAVTEEAIAVAALGDSESLTVGEPAIAIGNALGYGQSVTLGVISALDRVIDLSSSTGSRVNNEDGAAFIQTDAAINPGNSGGALLNMKGEVIGINSNKIGGNAVEGMGYAIPISAAKPIIEELMLKETREKVSEENKGYLGISPRTVADEMTEIYGMPKGVYVAQVYEGTGAYEAGIRKGNIITKFDGNKIGSAEDLLRVMEYYAIGDTVEVTVMYGSEDGWESKTVTVTLGEKFD